MNKKVEQLMEVLAEEITAEVFKDIADEIAGEAEEYARYYHEVKKHLKETPVGFITWKLHKDKEETLVN